MRLTGLLRQYAGTRENLVYKMRNRRKELGFIHIPKLAEEDALFAARLGVTVEDPNQLVQQKPRFPEWIPPKGFESELPIEEHPDMQEVAAYCFDSRTKLVEGLKQVLILTKTQPFCGMPERVTERLGKIQIPYQDELAQRIILQANIWDAHKEKVKRHRLPNTPIIWKFKAEFGIPETRTVRMMYHNFTRVFETLKTSYGDMSHRSLTRDHYMSSYYYYEGNPIHMQACLPMMLSSKKSLQPFADSAVIEDSVNHELPDLYPVSPLIDIKTSQIWSKGNNNGWPEDQDWHPHTAFEHYDDYDPKQPNPADHRNVRSLMTCLNMCLVRAKQNYGVNVKGVLPEPVCAQHIGMDAFGTTYLTFFQLNTMDFSSEGGVKNLVWFDNDQKLYKKFIPKRAMLRNTRYRDYSPAVFDKMLTMYMLDVDTENPLKRKKLTVRIVEKPKETEGKETEQEVTV